MDLFFELTKSLASPLTILDVGGLSAFWQIAGIPAGWKVHLINLMEQHDLPNDCTCEIGDACNLPYPDRSWDVVFSNSVLGHVGSWANQKRMTSEIRRIGVRYFVQTPNQWFPLDWRTLIPFFHWLHPSIQAWAHTKVRIGTYGRAKSYDEAVLWSTRVRNISYQEAQVLFPVSTIQRERVLGFCKSFVIHNFDYP